MAKTPSKKSSQEATRPSKVVRESRRLHVPDGIPDYIVDGVFGAMIVNDVARLTLFAMKNSVPEGVAEPVAVCRVAIPVVMLKQVNSILASIIKKVKTEGSFDMDDEISLETIEETVAVGSSDV